MNDNLNRKIRIYNTDPNNNYRSTEDTIKLMYSLVEEDAEDIRIDSITKGLGLPLLVANGNYDMVGKKVWEWVRTNFTYKEEEGEQLFAPTVMLHTRVGDCDDFSMLIMCLLRSAGVPKERLRFMTAITDESNTFTHVCVVMDSEKGLRAIDGSHGPYYGFPENRFSHVLW